MGFPKKSNEFDDINIFNPWQLHRNIYTLAVRVITIKTFTHPQSPYSRL